MHLALHTQIAPTMWRIPDRHGGERRCHLGEAPATSGMFAAWLQDVLTGAWTHKRSVWRCKSFKKLAEADSASQTCRDSPLPPSSKIFSLPSWLFWVCSPGLLGPLYRAAQGTVLYLFQSFRGFSFQFLKQFIEEGGCFRSNDPMYNHSYYVNHSVLVVCSAAVEFWVLQQMAFDKYYLTKNVTRYFLMWNRYFPVNLLRGKVAQTWREMAMWMNTRAASVFYLPPPKVECLWFGGILAVHEAWHLLMWNSE